jgi:hypothetical protein
LTLLIFSEENRYASRAIQTEHSPKATRFAAYPENSDKQFFLPR